MGRHCNIQSNNPSINLSQDVEEICSPFFKKYGINGFSYSRVFQDGSRSELWSDAEALYHTFLNKKYITDQYTPDNYKREERYIFLPNKIETYQKDIRKMYQ